MAGMFDRRIEFGNIMERGIPIGRVSPFGGVDQFGIVRDELGRKAGRLNMFGYLDSTSPLDADSPYRGSRPLPL